MSLTKIITGKTGPGAEVALKKLGYLSDKWEPRHESLTFGIAVVALVALAVGGLGGTSIGIINGVNNLPFQVAMGITGVSVLSGMIMAGCLAFQRHEYNEVLSDDRIKEFILWAKNDVEVRQKDATKEQLLVSKQIKTINDVLEPLNYQNNKLKTEINDLNSKLINLNNIILK